MARKLFTCAICDDDCRVSALSDYSLSLARPGTTRPQALEELRPDLLICRWCGDEDDVIEESEVGAWSAYMDDREYAGQPIINAIRLA